MYYKFVLAGMYIKFSNVHPRQNSTKTVQYGTYWYMYYKFVLAGMQIKFSTVHPHQNSTKIRSMLILKKKKVEETYMYYKTMTALLSVIRYKLQHVLNTVSTGHMALCGRYAYMYYKRIRPCQNSKKIT